MAAVTNAITAKVPTGQEAHGYDEDETLHPWVIVVHHRFKGIIVENERLGNEFWIGPGL